MFTGVSFFFYAKQKYKSFKEHHVKHIELFLCLSDLIFTVLNLGKQNIHSKLFWQEKSLWYTVKLLFKIIAVFYKHRNGKHYLYTNLAYLFLF